MIRLYASNQGIFNVPFVENETADEFLLRFKELNCVHFKGGAEFLQTIADGHTVQPGEIMLDRDYYLTVWLERA